MKPLAIDLFCGLGGWTDGLLAEGYDVIGFDITRHVYGEQRYPGMLAIQEAATGSEAARTHHYSAGTAPSQMAGNMPPP